MTENDDSTRLENHQGSNGDNISTSSYVTDGDGNNESMKTTTRHHNKSEQEEIAEALAKRETQFVIALRILVLLVIFASAVGAAFGVYRYTSRSQQEQFEESFEGDANKVLDEIGDAVDLSLTAIDSFTAAMTSYAHDKNATWPFVTIPNFERRASKIRTLSKSVFLTTCMIVNGDQRDGWNTYTSNNNYWINQSIAAQATDENYFGPLITDFYTLDMIHDYDENPYPASDLYIPFWQSSPTIPRYAPYSWNLLSYQPNVSAIAILDTHKTIIAESYHLPDPKNPEEVADNEIDVDFFRDFVLFGQDPAEPVFDIYYPILDVQDFITIDDPKDHELVGLITVAIYWRDLIENILPVGTDGVVVVFDNPCTASFTFQINGPDVNYLGRGDLHDLDFERYKIEDALLALDAFTGSSQTYAGVPIHDSVCVHSFRVYPSIQYEADFISNQPRTLTIVTIGIFLFASAVFIIFDRMVEYRQSKLLNTATKTSAIVSQLFPENVRDRLFDNQENNDDNNKGTRDRRHQGKKKSYRKNNRSESILESENNEMSLYLTATELQQKLNNRDTPPIADIFEKTSVFFGDLAGFTAWSSKRTPTEVFYLLETLYAAFDKVAKRRNVFKVETIGDCYVAVTGIPHEQKYHAILMVKFARDCMMIMSQLTNDLSLRLGVDTRDLEMRIGIHSGPTTAGVLRGEKGRFQLFGDTVNTASRMESTGVKGQIHISQETGNELLRHGKQQWITPRNDKVIAKGKGELQTYFVNFSYAAGTAMTMTERYDHDSFNDFEFDMAGYQQELQQQQQQQHVPQVGPTTGTTAGTDQSL